MSKELQFLIYNTPQEDIKVNVVIQDETVWLTQKTMAELFDCSSDNISLHLKNIFLDNELDEDATTEEFSVVQTEGARQVQRNQRFYNLDAIISVGYRVNSAKATQFRIWATKTLKEFIQKGFVMDDERLKQGTQLFGKDYFRELLDRVRSIRASERRIWQQITDIFAECSFDYTPHAQATKDFYAMVQNKFHFAIAGQTAAEIVYAKADRNVDHMGLNTWKNAPDGRILKADVSTAKNYLSEKDIKYTLNQRIGAISVKDQKTLMPKFFNYFLNRTQQLTKYNNGIDQTNLRKGQILDVQIPIPCPDNPEKSLEIQIEIVRILDAFTALTTELSARKKQYNYYRDQLLSFEEGEVEWKALGEIFDIFAGGDKPKDVFSDVETEEFKVPVLSNGIGKKSLYGWTNKGKIEKPSLTVSARGTIGWTSYREQPFFPIIRLLVLTPKIQINLKYAYYFMKTIENDYKVPPAGIPQLTKPMIKNVPIPIPFPTTPKNR